MAKGTKWHGVQDSTPCSGTERDPNYQPEERNSRIDWKGMGDSSPESAPERDPKNQSD